MTEEDKIKWIYSSKDNQELAQRYAEWSEHYDYDLMEAYGWYAPQHASEFVVKYVPQKGKVLDAGAGTGLVGLCLREWGYGDLVAIDLSEEMLSKARDKNVYRELHQMVLGERLDFSDDSFDGVVCVGVLTFGHAPARSLEELTRVTRPRGHIVFSLRTDAHERLGFKEMQGKLESAGTWKVVEVSEPYQSFSRKEQDVFHRIWVYEVL
jgi:SAM-dependent methyltransferase